MLWHSYNRRGSLATSFWSSPWSKDLPSMAKWEILGRRNKGHSILRLCNISWVNRLAPEELLLAAPCSANSIPTVHTILLTLQYALHMRLSCLGKRPCWRTRQEEWLHSLKTFRTSHAGKENKPKRLSDTVSSPGSTIFRGAAQV